MTKLTVTMKSPDALSEAINEAVAGVENEGERQEIKDWLRIKCQRWFEYGEYLTVDIDVDTEACVVRERRR